MDWSPEELKMLFSLQDSGMPVHAFTVKLHCTNCPWACFKDIRSGKLSYYNREEIYKCPLCSETTVKCEIEK